MSCIQVDGGFNTGVTAISNQVEDSVSSGMLLTSAYADYFQEFDRWPDSHAKLIEYYKTKAKTDASLIAVYEQLEEFTEVKVVGIEDRIIELEFRRPPISPGNDNRSVATGKVIIFLRPLGGRNNAPQKTSGLCASALNKPEHCPQKNLRAICG